MTGFHRWAAGNLLDNTVRGLFAEYIIHQALGLNPGQHRIEWAKHDISFKIKKRSSTFDVFALLAVQDRSRVNPADLSR
jgi:hypothetical protein